MIQKDNQICYATISCQRILKKLRENWQTTIICYHHLSSEKYIFDQTIRLLGASWIFLTLLFVTQGEEENGEGSRQGQGWPVWTEREITEITIRLVLIVLPFKDF